MTIGKSWTARSKTDDPRGAERYTRLPSAARGAAGDAAERAFLEHQIPRSASQIQDRLNTTPDELDVTLQEAWWTLPRESLLRYEAERGMAKVKDAAIYPLGFDRQPSNMLEEASANLLDLMGQAKFAGYLARTVSEDDANRSQLVREIRTAAKTAWDRELVKAGLAENPEHYILPYEAFWKAAQAAKRAFFKYPIPGTQHSIQDCVHAMRPDSGAGWHYAHCMRMFDHAIIANLAYAPPPEPLGKVLARTLDMLADTPLPGPEALLAKGGDGKCTALVAHVEQAAASELDKQLARSRRGGAHTP